MFCPGHVGEGIVTLVARLPCASARSLYAPFKTDLNIYFARLPSWASARSRWYSPSYLDEVSYGPLGAAVPGHVQVEVSEPRPADGTVGRHHIYVWLRETRISQICIELVFTVGPECWEDTCQVEVA